MKLSGVTPRPWVKLWREERGRFGQLPLFARALGAELLKVTEMDGSIVLGGRDPIDAIAIALGADAGDRRLLRKYLPMLVEVGYLEREGDVLHLPAWFRRQGLDVANATRTEHEQDASATRTVREPDANATRTRREIEGKPSEGLSGTQSADQEGEGEREEEGEGEKRSAPRAAAQPDVDRRIADLSARYPAPLLASVHEGCRLHRESARMAPTVWLATLERLAAHPLDVVVRAMTTFADRYGAGAKNERYLLGIVSGEARERKRMGAQRSIVSVLGPPAPPEAYPDGGDTWDLTGATG